MYHDYSSVMTLIHHFWCLLNKVFKVSEQICILFTHVLSALPFLSLAIRPFVWLICYHSPFHAPLINFPWRHLYKNLWCHYCFNLTSRVDLVSTGVVILSSISSHVMLLRGCWKAEQLCVMLLCWFFHVCFILLFTPTPIYKDHWE